VSVLTEPSRFSGSLEHLRAVAATLAPLGVPAMRKDFLVDPYQLYEARAAGAGGALLIVRMLSPATLGEMLDCARELGLFVLIETFDEADIVAAVEALDRVDPLVPGTDSGPARGTQPKAVIDVLLGVNSRDLQTLAVVPERLEQLAPRLPREYPRVAESGLTTPDDAARMVRAGYDMALVGGALMSAPDPGALVRAMLAAGRAAAA
jgi:indole-3-glycerol phosphate synthase